MKSVQNENNHNLAARKILPAWFDNLEEVLSYKELQFKEFCWPVVRFFHYVVGFFHYVVRFFHYVVRFLHYMVKFLYYVVIT